MGVGELFGGDVVVADTTLVGFSEATTNDEPDSLRSPGNSQSPSEPKMPQNNNYTRVLRKSGRSPRVGSAVSAGTGTCSIARAPSNAS